jgi:site-specific recombinase XerD
MTIYKIADESETLKEAIEDFIAFKKAQQVSDLTMRDYTETLSKFLAESQNSLDEEILSKDVLNYFAAIPDTSPARYNKPYQYLNSFFNWATKNNLLIKNPLTANGLKKKRDDGNIHAAPIEDVKKLLTGFDKKTFSGFRNYVLTLLMLDTGMRTSELRQLKDAAFDANAKQIYIDKNICKTRKNRIVYLSDKTAKEVAKLIRVKPQGFSDLIFPTREGKLLTNRHLAKEFEKACAKTGVKITPYQLRHTFATYFIENGGDVFTLQDLMGHSDLRMTKRYTDVNENQKKKQHNTYSPLNALQGAPRLTRI